ncbi:type 4a pilus biogenesis protein PilO [Rheinheimera sp.]|uniref:type 4a pilus biogenesis protein PilO n=1 Tax=Rheinheimera sp. TaxID=1869214 RepID=UPI003AF53C84
MNLKMNLSELDLAELDFSNMGSWPKAGRVVVAVVLALLVLIGSYLFLVDPALVQLQAEQQKEKELRESYRSKYSMAVNLPLYQQQMQQMEQMLAGLLQQLPSSRETPGMLDDITFAGTSVGLSFVRIHWMPEIEKEFYTELPIQIEVLGTYHQVGLFVSAVAALPRIVTLHDFQLKTTETEQLNFSVVAKTYRYKEAKAPAVSAPAKGGSSL